MLAPEVERVAEEETDQKTQTTVSPSSLIIPVAGFPLVGVYPYFLKQCTVVLIH